MSLTTDKTDENLNKIGSDGQNVTYLILSEEERAKGFIRPVRQSYQHVGSRPKYPLRDLTDKEKEDYAVYGYVKFEQYPASEGVVGRYWTKKKLNSGCGVVTKMGIALSETWARDIDFYNATFCVGCGAHLPVEEFVWDGTDEVLGS